MTVRDELEKVTQEDFVEAARCRLQESITASKDDLVWMEHLLALANRYPAYKIVYAALVETLMANPNHGDHRCAVCFLEGQRTVLEILTLL